MRTLFRIVLILLMAHAIYRFLPPYYHNERFGTELKEVAPFWQEITDQEVIQRLLDLAAKHKVPITGDHVKVAQQKDSLVIDINYQVPIEWVPGLKKPWKFDQHHNIWIISPKKYKVPGPAEIKLPAP